MFLHTSSGSAATRALLLALTMCGCDREAGPTQPPVASAPAKDDAPAGPPVIDGARMYATLAALSDDAMKGRATFAPEIAQAIELLAKAYREAGIAPVGDDYRMPYTIVTGAEQVNPPTLQIGKQTIAPEQFVARNLSANGRAEGELVFVGYGMRAQGATPSYDDLAGVDVKGRIAIVLTDAPGRPDLDELLAVMRTKLVAHETAMAPIRAKNDAKAAKRQVGKLFAELRKVLAPYWRGPKPAKALTELPADPLAQVELLTLLEQVRVEADALPGPKFDPRASRLSNKLARLSEAGAIGAIVVEGARTHVDTKQRDADVLPPLGTGVRGDAATFPVVQLRWHEAESAVRIGGKSLSKVQAQIDRKLVPASKVLAGATASLSVELKPIEKSASNVLAKIDGSDLAHEIVIVGAHFDHIGIDGRDGCHATTRADGKKDEICNGADDNGSGTVAVLELARAFAAAKLKPRRTIVFAHFSGEEIGLHGSKALAESPPKAAPFDNGKVVAMINMDMIGRLGAQGLAVGGIGSSDGWMPLLEKIGTHDMNVVYERSVTTRSDHASFYRKQVPVLFFFTGLHPDYHAPGDELAGISKDGMTKIAELVAELVLAVADGAAVPYTPPKSEDEGLTGALPGNNPATIAKPPTKP
ncbi:MAG TPA: M20/M25/M40 family metallo-hydrolase [Nannocystaceae bacterium]|nr:M20/M25/M40 family metallo-hydrolase [Nannocystaceae bacterium]